MRIAVIGAGAAGVFGAISAATHDPSKDIVVIEAAQQPLAKVRISGGGRCNVTNHCFDPSELIRNYPRGNKELLGPFNRFQPRDTVAWFKKHGVRLKVENDGRMFPTTDKSETIAVCLLDAIAKHGIKIRLGVRVNRIELAAHNRNSHKFNIIYHNSKLEQYDQVLLATGGGSQGHCLAEALGHNIIPSVPSLFTFRVIDPRLNGLAGVGFENVELTLLTGGGKKLKQTGPLLIAHWGLTGPSVLKLSAWGARMLHRSNYKAELIVNFLPNQGAEQLYKELLTYRGQNSKKRVWSGNALPVPKRYWNRIVQLAGITEETIWSNMTKPAMKSIVDEFSQARFAVSGKGVFKDEFVTCGGVDLKEVDFRTMQSKRCTGLFFAGEILDIDGLTGGFNLQNAWTTGWIAGANMIL